MNLHSKPARRAVAAVITAALLLGGCQENTVVENGDLPQSVDTVNELTSTTPAETTAEETTTTTTSAATTTTTTTTTATEETTSAETQPASVETTASVQTTAGYTAVPAATQAPQAAQETTAAQTSKTTSAPRTIYLTAAEHVSGYRGGTDYPEIKHDLEYMRELNTDFIGWFTVEDTPIDSPVVQAIDNKFYLTHDFYGRTDPTKVGVTFADYHVQLSEGVRPQNLIIYGHNIRTGVGLAKMTNYYPSRYGSLNFYYQNPTIEFESVFGGESTYIIFAGMFVNTQEKHGSVFNYYKFYDFSKENTFYQYFEAVMDRSVFYNPDIDIKQDDTFLTVSTCYYPLGMGIDTRFVVFARQIRKGEKTINVSNAYINPSPLYFDYYYAANGGSWAGRNWPTSLIQGYDKWLEKQDS